LNRWDANWNCRLTQFFGEYPKEMQDAGPAEWQNQVGTGAFILTEYVKDSYVICDRNPNYWETVTINGKEYQLPFVDRIIQPIVVDPATQIAALRTAKIDMHTEDPMTYVESLAQTNPDLLRYKYLLGDYKLVSLKCDSTYFSDRDVRRAMMIGTDLNAICEALYVDGMIHGHPLNANTGDIYTPIDELPASTALLFEYNPTLAKQMLADAGYPDGFSIELVTLSDPDFQDAASMLAGYWEKIGVTTKLVTMERAQHTNIRTTREYQDAFLWNTGSGFAPGACNLGYWGDPALSFMNNAKWNWDGTEDPTYSERFLEMQEETDYAKAVALAKQLCIELNDGAAYIPLANPYMNCMTWPWVKNYYGEQNCGFVNYSAMENRIWIDQDMKTEMGYK